MEFNICISNQKSENNLIKKRNKKKKKKKKIKGSSKNNIDEKVKNLNNLDEPKNLDIKNNNEEEEKNGRINKISEIIPESKRYLYFIDNELNTLEYKYAINIDFRTFFQFYWSLLKQIHLIFFTFVSRNDYNLFLSKLSLFLMSFSFTIALNTIFFLDETMHKLYENYGDFDFLYNLPQTIYSILISGFITYFFEFIALSEDNLSNFKKIENLEYIEINKKKEIKYLKIKNIIFLTIGIIFLLFIWYYISCFCSVYYNTQIHLIKNIFISFGTGMIYPFIFTLMPSIIRIPALRKKRTCLYKFSRILSFAISLI